MIDFIIEVKKERIGSLDMYHAHAIVNGWSGNVVYEKPTAHHAIAEAIKGCDWGLNGIKDLADGNNELIIKIKFV